MKNNIINKFILLVLMGVLFFTGNVIYAKNLSVNTYEFGTNEVIKDTGKMINLTTYTFCKPSTSMDFVDENGYFNNVYISDNNVYWSKYDDNMNQTSTKTLPLLYNINKEENSSDMYKILTYNFGNAVYYNGHLYVMYSRYTSRGLTRDEYKEEKVMAMVKYDKNGEAVATREYKTVELSNSYSVGDLNYTTCAPFYSGNCSLAINDGIIACFYGRNMYNNHQSSALIFIEPNSLEIVSDHQNETSNPDKYWSKYYEPYGHNISHSLGQRIIATNDGQFLMMESGDAGILGATRGLMLTKLYEEYDSKIGKDVIKKSTKKMVHYSEGSTGSNGYNCTYSVLGNIIELNDGYMYVGGLDKNINQAYGSGLDSPWNVFIQKYDKNFYDMSSQKEMQLLKNTSIRKIIGEKPTNTSNGRLYLKGDEEDHGIKWLTNLDDTRTAILVRAIKIKNDNIVILWEEDKMNKSDYGGYYISSTDNTSHFMIIDKDGNTIVEDTILDNISISDEEQYVYKDGKIYWTTANGRSKKVTVNTLEVDKYLQNDFIKGDLDDNGIVNANDAAIALDLYKYGNVSKEELKIGDMDNNGIINANDAALILDIYKYGN